MASIINTNISSLTAQRNLGMSQASLATSMQRLSSGLRINSAKDDAAGLAISDRMTGQIKGMNQAVRNANDGISLAQTAEGALGEIGNNLQRIRELAVQAANDTNTSADRASINTEVTQLKDEIDRVANTTSFNNNKLLDASFTSKVFQVGANANETISITGIAGARLTDMGSVTAATTQSLAIGSLDPTVAIVSGDLTINTVDIGAISVVAGATSTDRANQLVKAINDVSSTTGVNAAIDTVSNKITLTSAAAIDLGGTVANQVNTLLATGFDSSLAAVATTSAAANLSSLSVLTQAGATLALKQVDSALTTLNSTRATLGSIQNRFTSVVNNLQSASENLSASRSRIQDADFAAETANLSRSQILQQAGTAMVAQANQLPQSVLSLLK